MKSPFLCWKYPKYEYFVLISGWEIWLKHCKNLGKLPQITGSKKKILFTKCLFKIAEIYWSQNFMKIKERFSDSWVIWNSLYYFFVNFLTRSRNISLFYNINIRSFFFQSLRNSAVNFTLYILVILILSWFRYRKIFVP